MTDTHINFMSLPDYTFRKVQGMLAISFIDPITLVPTGRLKSVGSCTVELDIKNEFIEFRDNQRPRRDRIGRRLTMSDSTLKIGMQQYVGDMFAQMLMAPTGQFIAQTAHAVQTLPFVAVQALDILELGDGEGNNFYDVTGVVVTATTAATPMVLNVDYRLDAYTGLIQVVNPPMDGLVSVAFVTPAIVANQGKQAFALLQQPETYARIVLRQDNLVGQNLYLTWPKVQLSPPTSIKLVGNGNEAATTEIEGAILSDTRFPGYENGWGSLVV